MVSTLFLLNELICLRRFLPARLLSMQHGMSFVYVVVVFSGQDPSCTPPRASRGPAGLDDIRNEDIEEDDDDDEGEQDEVCM